MIARKFLLLICIIPYISALPEPLTFIYLDNGIGGSNGTMDGSTNIVAAIKEASGAPEIKHTIQALASRKKDSYSVASLICSHLPKKPICMVNSLQISAMCHIAEMKGLPCLSVVETDMTEREESSCYLNFHPSRKALSQAYAQTLRALGWKSLTIIYEDFVEEIVSEFMDIGINIKLRKIPQGGDYRSILHEIKFSGETEIVLSVPWYKAYPILKQAKEKGMMNNYNYFLTSLDLRTQEFIEFGTLGVSIIGMRLVDPENAAHYMDKYENTHRWGRWNITPNFFPADLALTYDAARTFMDVLLEMEHSEVIEGPPEMTCSEGKWKYGPQIVQKMKMMETEGLTGTIKFDSSGERLLTNMDIVRLTARGVAKLGKWEIKGVNFVPEYTKHMSPWNHTVVVTTVLSSPYVMRKSNQDDGAEPQFEGFSIDIIKELSNMLSFNYKIMLTDDGKYGSYDKNTGEWNGMVADLMRQKADMAISDLTITSERQEAVDFSIPIMNAGISILYEKTSIQTPSLNFFLMPFSQNLWLYLAASCIGMALLLFILSKLSPYEWKGDSPFNDNPEQENRLSFLNSMWFTIGSSTQQGSNVIPRAISTRIASGVWWFFVMIMVSFYTANLAAMLSARNMAQPIQSIEDLVRQTSIKYGSLYGGSTLQFFKNSDNPIYQRIWATMDSDPSVFTRTTAEGVNRVSESNGKYAFFMESTSIEYITERQCDLVQVGGLLNSKAFGIALPKDSPQRTIINGALLKMQETGKLQAIKAKWWQHRNDGGSCVDAIGEPTELQTANVGGLFVILIAGMVLACVTALIELSWKYRRAALKITATN